MVLVSWGSVKVWLSIHSTNLDGKRVREDIKGVSKKIIKLEILKEERIKSFNLVKTWEELTQELEEHFEGMREYLENSRDSKFRWKSEEKNNWGKNFIRSFLEMCEEINDLDEHMKLHSASYKETFNPRGTNLKLNHFIWWVGVMIAIIRTTIIIHII